MTISAFDVQKGAADTTDAGTNVLKRAVTSPSAGDVFYFRLDVGTGTTLTEASSAAPLHVELVDVTNTVVADVGNILTSVQLLDDAVYADDADWTDGSSKHLLTGGLYQSTPQTITDGDVGPFQVTSNGYLITSVNGTVTVDASGTTVPVSNAGLTELAAAINASSQMDVNIAAQDSNVTVDGTVTANLGATDNAVLDQIETNTSYGDNTGGGTESGSLRVTIANDSTGVISVDDNGGSLTVDGTVTADAGSGTFAVGGVAAHDAAASGNPVLLGAEFDDTATDTVDEGDVGKLRINDRRALYTTFETPAGDSPWDDTNDALQVNIVAGSSSGTEYTEDVAAPGDPAGGAVLLRREDSPVSIAADGDWVAQNATQYGAAFCQIVDSSGNFIDTFGGSGGTSATDDGNFTAGSGSGTPMMGFVSADLVDSGDVGVVAMSTDRRLHVDSQIVGQDADITIADGGNSITVDGTVTANLSATDNAVLDQIDSNTDFGATTGGGTESGALRVTLANDSTGVVSVDDNGGSLTVDGTVTANLGATDNAVLDQIEVNTSYGDNTGGGTESGALRVTIANNSTGLVSVDDNGGSLSVDYGGTAPTVSNAGVQVTGDEAHDAADAGNPIKIGHKAIAIGANPTDVAANDRTDSYAMRNGIPFMLGGHPNIVTREWRATGSQTNDAIIDSIAAGTAIVITQIQVTADNANTNDTGVRIGFGTASIPTEPTNGNSATGVVLSHPGIAAGSGASRGSGAGIVAMGATNEELRITNEDPGGSIKVVVSYFTVSI